MSKSFAFLAIICFIIFSFLGFQTFQLSKNYKTNCKSHVNAAAHATTIEHARDQLHQAISFLNTHNMTFGSTALITNTDETDLAVFYNNLWNQWNELYSLPENTTTKEKADILMKLEAKLLTKHGDVRDPWNIHLYPNVGILHIGKMFSTILMLVFALLAGATRK